MTTPTTSQAVTSSREISLIPADLQSAYAKYVAEWSRKSINIPEIKISYEPDSEGEFFIKKEDKVTALGKSISVAILKIRNQYNLYDADKTKQVRTNEFDSFRENITLYVGGEPIKTAPFAEVKAIIKGNQDYAKAKFINVIYCLIDGQIHRIYSKPASRNNLWAYQADTGTKAPFAFTTKIHTTKERNGTVTFFPMHFENTGDVTSEDLSKNIRLRMELDEALRALDNMRVTTKDVESAELPPPPAEEPADEVFNN